MRAIFYCLLVMCLGLCLFGCSARFPDSVPIAMNPSYIRIKLNSIHSVSVFFSSPRKEKGVLSFNVDDASIVRPASTNADINVKPGEESIAFEIQGVKEGETTLFATLDGARISAKVLVVKK